MYTIAKVAMADSTAAIQYPGVELEQSGIWALQIAIYRVHTHDTHNQISQENLSTAAACL